jgi:predicted dehydrogenase
MEAEDTVAAALHFPHGALGVIEAATSAFPGTDLRLEIIGDRGTGVLINDRVVRWEFAERVPEDDQVLESADKTVIKGGTSDPMAMTNEGHCRLVDDLVAALREGRQPIISGTEARRAVALVLAIYEAARSGQRTRVTGGARLLRHD